MDRSGCDGRVNDWISTTEDPNGKLYAPFVMERFTKAEPSPQLGHRRASIYWLVSTWAPYQVSVMRTLLDFRGTPTIITPDVTKPTLH